MKKIECLVSHKIFHTLEQKLREIGIPGLTVSDVRGYGNEQTRPESYLLLPKIKMEIFCRDEDAEEIIATVCKVSNTGELGAGKIAIYEISDLVRIRTGERGNAAV